MALQVWLPLDGNLENKGISDVTVTNNGATVDNNGKIGKCYSFDGSNDYLTGTYNAGIETSFAAWIYLPTLPGGKHIFDARTSSGTGYQPMYLNNTSIQIGSSGSGYATLNYTWTANTWYHVCVTHNATEGRCYINGSLIGSSTTAKGASLGICNFTLGSRCNQANYSNVKINDVRIYDHCLSPKEVKEIAQGLILHYKLDRWSDGAFETGKNLLLGTKMDTPVAVNSNTDFTKYFRRYNGNDGLHTFTSIGNGAYQDKIALSVAGNIGIAFGRLAEDMDLDTSSQYTLSCDAMCTKSGAHLDIGLSYYTTSNTWTWRGGQNAKNFTATNTWQHFSLTFTPDANTKAICYCFTVAGTAGGTDTFTIKNCKLEKGTTSTAWAPAPEEQGLAIAKIVDSSGYGRYGTIIGSLTTETTDKRYNTAVHISATSTKIKIPAIQTTGFGDSYSFAWWGKMSSVAPMHWGFADGIRLNGLYNGVLWNTGDSAENPLYVPGTTTQVTAPTVNTWHHWVMTGDGTSCKVYQDGVLWGVAKTYKSISGTTIYINGWNETASYSSNNFSVSDFRIYSTALSAEDVADLYNTSASIDNFGNLHGFQFNEGASSFSISKDGDINSATFSSIIQLQDGSEWMPILYHNVNNGSNLFSSSDDFSSPIYHSNECWCDFSIINTIERYGTNYEFLVMQQNNTDQGKFTQYRWAQTKNPWNATWEDVNPSSGNITHYDGVTAYGGLYKFNGSVFWSFANNNSSNWFGCAHKQLWGGTAGTDGNVPGYMGMRVSGWQNVYIRIKNNYYRQRNKISLATDFIEK